MSKKQNPINEQTVANLYEECVVAAYQRACEVLNMVVDDPIVLAAQASFAAAVLANPPIEPLRNVALPAVELGRKALSEMTSAELAALRQNLVAKIESLGGAAAGAS